MKSGQVSQIPHRGWWTMRSPVRDGEPHAEDGMLVKLSWWGSLWKQCFKGRRQIEPNEGGI